MKLITIRTPWPDRSLSPNARVNRWAKADAIKNAKRMAWALTTKALLDEQTEPLRTGRTKRICIRLIVTPPSRRYMDEDNLLATCKASLDGIAKALHVDDCAFHFLEQDWREPDGSKGAIDFEVSWRVSDADGD